MSHMQLNMENRKSFLLIGLLSILRVIKNSYFDICSVEQRFNTVVKVSKQIFIENKNMINSD